MTTEEKAKAYDKALEKASKLRVQNPFDTVSQMMEHVFPELGESEDEKIRKDIMVLVKDWWDRVNKDNISTKEQMIAWLEKQKDTNVLIQEASEKAYTEGMRVERKHWLEKQDEQKPILDFKASNWYVSEVDGKIHDLTYNPADKIKPKFKVGDWIIDNNIKTPFLITSISNEKYDVISIYGTDMSFSFREVERFYHLWTIQDAKDGDVLYHSDTASNGIFIFKELLEYEFGKKVICYCDYDSEDGFCLGESHTCCWTDAKILHPATKEQCNTLFAKIKEAGYEWDAENKKLNKIEHKSVWSKEDEKRIDRICDFVWKNRKGDTDEIYQQELDINWFKSLKHRVQPKQIWSEEDEKMLNFSIKHYVDANMITWLESLKTKLGGK